MCFPAYVNHRIRVSLLGLKVVELKIPKAGEPNVGACFVKFEAATDAAKAREALHNRAFDGNTVTAAFIDEATF